MGCISASTYTSGTILATFTGSSASGDCDQECGICCYPACDTNVTPTDEFVDGGCYYLQRSSNSIGSSSNVPSSVYWISGPPPGAWVILSRISFCEDYVFLGEQCEGYEENQCGNVVNKYGGYEKVQLKLLVCNEDGTWSDETNNYFDSTKRITSSPSCPNSVGTSIGGYFWPPNFTGCGWADAGQCDGPNGIWPDDYGPWFDHETDVWLEEVMTLVPYPYTDCCSCIGDQEPCPIVCQEEVSGTTAPPVVTTTAQPPDGYCVTEYTWSVGGSLNCPSLTMLPWAVTETPTYICGDYPKGYCIDDVPGGLWITGNTCETYDCSVHDAGGVSE